MQENQTQQEQKDWTKNALISFDETAKAMVPRNFEGLWRMAEIMARSGMMPTNMEKPETVFVAVQMGLEVGLPPMAAVQNIAVINGRPSIWGDAVLGLVRSSGQLERFKEASEGEFPKDNFMAVCIAKRKGDPDEIKREFSIADAKNAGLWCQDHPTEKQKFTPWFKYPKRMLQMRARSWALRDGFGDVLRGLQMREEVQDIIDVTPDRTGKYTADDITEKLKANATEERAPVKPISQTEGFVNAIKGDGKSAVPGEQTTATAETKTEGDFKTAKDQGPPSSAWDPYTAEIMGRYLADKTDILKAELSAREILFTSSMTGRELHELLLDSLTPQDDEETGAAASQSGASQKEDPFAGNHHPDCRCPECDVLKVKAELQADAHKKLLDEREAKRKALYGGEPSLSPNENKALEDDFDENAPQKMAGNPAPTSKEDLRNRYIAMLAKAGEIDRSIWLKSRQQVGLISGNPVLETMPLEKLIEWAALAQSMTEGKKNMQFS